MKRRPLSPLQLPEKEVWPGGPQPFRRRPSTATKAEMLPSLFAADRLEKKEITSRSTRATCRCLIWGGGVERGEDGEAGGGAVLIPGGVRGRLVLAGIYNTAKGVFFVLWRVEEGEMELGVTLEELLHCLFEGDKDDKFVCEQSPSFALCSFPGEIRVL
ncbi:hypothetical protein MRB53_021984 [Persea americana]|uniref:Uncharacterized protein n=1 Tax=Persea americana TaxID=3435 RepID=A0ACC2L591_PERAE|nr:hypothetical protein MRB53_021984 [Persea americana]